VGSQQAAIQGAMALQPGERAVEATARPGKHAERVGIERGDIMRQRVDGVRRHRRALRREL